MPETLNKITIKSVLGKVNLPLEEEDLMILCGVVKVVKIRQGDIGEFIVLYGDFFALDRKAGKEYLAERAVLPESITKAIVTQLGKPKVKAVDFASVIGCRPAKTLSGMEWFSRALMPPATHDILHRLVYDMHACYFADPKQGAKSKEKGAAPAKKKAEKTPIPIDEASSQSMEMFTDVELGEEVASQPA